MILNVKVIPNAKKVRIAEEKDMFKVYVKAPAIEGKANRELIEVLSEHFNVRKGSVRIVRGEKSNKKIIEIGK